MNARTPISPARGPCCCICAKCAGDRRAVDALVAKIETEMLVHNAALSLCRYSDQPFNTSEILWPDWRAIPLHAPTALAGAAALLALLAGGIGLTRLAIATR